MGDCDNTVKQKAIRWWTRMPTKGGSLPRSGAGSRARSDQLWRFKWRKAQPQSKQTEHVASQIRVPDTVAQANLSDSPQSIHRDTVSLFLKNLLVQRLDADRAAHEIEVAAAQDLAETSDA